MGYNYKYKFKVICATSIFYLQVLCGTKTKIGRKNKTKITLHELRKLRFSLNYWA